MPRAVIFAVVVSLVGPCSPALAAADRLPQRLPGPTIDQWLSLARASEPQFAPDGKRVAFVVSKIDWKADLVVDQVWTADVVTRATRLLTSGLLRCRRPRWYPDGRRIAFLSSREGVEQVYAMPAEGGDAVRMTTAERGVSSFALSPDGRWIAFASETAPGENVAAKRAERFGFFHVVGEPSFTAVHLWVTDARHPTEARRLTHGAAMEITGFSWRPDSTALAFSAGSGSGATGEDAIFLIGLDKSEPRRVAPSPGFDGDPIWSPGGQRIAFITSGAALSRPVGRARNSYVAVVDATGHGFDVMSAAFDEIPSLVGWSRYGLYFFAREGASGHLFRVEPDTKVIHRVTAPGTTSQDFQLAPDGNQVVLILANGESLGEVAVSALPAFSSHTVTDFDAQLRPFDHSRREVFHWTSPDGTPMEGVLVKPAGFDPSRRYPLLVTIHGGPIDAAEPKLGHDIPYPVEAFVARGALVLQPNYRGSAGYGESFRQALVGNLGLPQYLDVISGVDALISRGWVDPERLGAMGWSHGGYVASFITTFSRRFKAVSVGAGVSDWTTFYTNTDEGPGWPTEYVGGSPWDVPEQYRVTAPLTYVKTAVTPTLIQHGERDRRAPLAGAYELYRALRDEDVPAKMIVYDGAGHAGRSFTPKQFRALMQHNLDWFLTWIWGNPNDDGRAGITEVVAAHRQGEADALVRGAEEAYAKAVREGDVPALQRLLAEDFTATTSRGERRDRSAEIGDLVTPGWTVDAFELEDVRVQLLGKVAVVTGRQRLRASHGDQSSASTFRYTRVYVRRLGIWSVVTQQLTRLAS